MSRWKPGRRRSTQIDGQFAARTIKMLESPAFRVLSLSARRALDRLEIELAHHGGMDNGRLAVTYEDFEKYGMDRHAIAPAIRELVALGLAEVTVHGRAGNAEWRTPNRFRITYKPTKEAAQTHEWKRIYTDDQAEKTAREARSVQPVRPKHRRKNKTPVGENDNLRVGTHHLGPVGKFPITASGEEPTLLSISWDGDGELGARRLSSGRVREILEADESGA